MYLFRFSMFRTIAELDATTSGRRAKILTQFVKLLHEAYKPSANNFAFPMLECYLTGNAKKMHEKVRQYVPAIKCIIPTPGTVLQLRDELRIEFMKEWKLDNIPRGKYFFKFLNTQ